MQELVRHHEEWQRKQEAIEGGALHPGRLLVRVKHGQHTMGKSVSAYVFLRLGAQMLHKVDAIATSSNLKCSCALKIYESALVTKVR